MDNDTIEAAACAAVDQFYLMYPQAKHSLPKTARQSLKQYIIGAIKKELSRPPLAERLAGGGEIESESITEPRRSAEWKAK